MLKIQAVCANCEEKSPAVKNNAIGRGILKRWKEKHQEETRVSLDDGTAIFHTVYTELAERWDNEENHESHL